MNSIVVNNELIIVNKDYQQDSRDFSRQSYLFKKHLTQNFKQLKYGSQIKIVNH